MIIASNFRLYSRKFLDERQQSESLEALNANIVGKLYPYGFEVFCIQEGKWYQNIARSGMPIWEERKGGANSDIDINSIISDEEISDKKTWSSEYIYSLQSDLEQLITNNEDYITEIEDRLLLVEGDLMLLDGFDGSYDSLTNKPNIPSLDGYATETFVNNAIANAQLGGDNTDINLNGYVTKEDFDNLEKVKTSDTEPTEEDVSIWIDISEEDTELIIPRINDDVVADNTTWSSEKINNAIKNIDVTQVEGYTANNNLKTKLDVGVIPTKISQLTNDSNFINSIPPEYITEDELNNMGYLTSNDISNLATKTELHNHTNKMILDNITEDMINEWNKKIEFDGNYNNLINKPIIPTKVSQLTNDSNFLNSIPSEYITEIELDAKGYLTKHQDISHLANKSEIPTKISDLIDDSNFITEIPSEYITENELHNMGYLTSDDVPTKISHLIDDSNFVTENELYNMDYLTNDDINNLATRDELFSKDYNDLTNKPNIPSIEGLASEEYVDNAINDIIIPTKISDLTNDNKYVTDIELNSKNYLTEHQDISHLANKDELHNHMNKATLDNITEDMINDWNNKSEFNGDYNNLINKPIIPSIDGLASEKYVNGAIGNLTIPTKISQLTNDSNFITNIPSEYITEDELNNMGYLTSNDISNLATKTELNAKADKNNIPTKTSQLTNDSNYLTNIPPEYITEDELNNMGYLTSDDISNLATKTELNAKADKNVIPTKVSQLTNDSNFISNIPSEYITEDELSAMNYATVSQIPTSLPANGGNADTVGGFSVWFGTQEQYDAIEVKNATTIYLIQYIEK